MNSSWAVVKDYTADCASAIGTQNGTATAGISLVGVTATADLPAGNFYFLYAVFQNSTGTDVNIAGVTPISIERAVIPVTGVSITDASVSLNIGNTITLQAEVTPADATNKEVVWSSANESIATVDASTGAVTAVSAGTTTITVTTVDGGYTATVEVSVLPSTIIIVIEAEQFSSMGGVNQNGVRGGKVATLGDITYMWEIVATDWLEYTFNVSVAADYQLNFVAASNQANQNIEYYLDGVKIGTQAITRTGSLTVFGNNEVVAPLALSVGTHTFRCVATGTYLQWNLDKIILTAEAPVASVPVTSVTLNDDAESLYLGSTYQLNASVLPVDADEEYRKCKYSYRRSKWSGNCSCPGYC